MKHFIFLLRLIAAAILAQTLFFKFSGAPESIYIFSKLGVEPYGRWFAGISEAIACVLLLVPATQVLGALLALGIMLGALLSHFFVLGIIVQDDGGLLFVLALTVALCSTLIVYLQRDQLVNLVRKRLLPIFKGA